MVESNKMKLPFTNLDIIIIIIVTIIITITISYGLCISFNYVLLF